MAEVEQRGISAVLTINGDTRAVQQMLRDLPAQLGKPKDPSNLDLTLIYPYETIIDVFSDRDLKVLHNAETRMHRYLGSLPLREVVLKPADERLKKFCRFMAVPILETPFLLEARSTLAEIVENETGRPVKNRSYEAHLSVSRRTKTTSQKLLSRTSAVRFPRNIHVNGYDVGQRILGNNLGRSRQGMAYVNSPERRG